MEGAFPVIRDVVPAYSIPLLVTALKKVISDLRLATEGAALKLAMQAREKTRKNALITTRKAKATCIEHRLKARVEKHVGN